MENTELHRRLNYLEKYIHSWYKNRRLKGLMITYWNQSLTPIEHVMHYFPIIIGYVQLNTSNSIQKAKDLGDRLIDLQEENGFFKNSWGDIPPHPTAPVIQSAAAVALVKLYKATQQEKYLDAALKSFSYIIARWWNGKYLSNKVANQTAVFVWLMTELYELNPTQNLRGKIESSLNWILKQQLPCGAFYQGDHDPRLYLVYNAKILVSLLNVFKILQIPELRNSTALLANFLKNNYQKFLFPSFYQLKIPPYPVYSKIYGMLKFVPVGRKLLLSYRKYFSYKKVVNPVLIARNALVIYGLYLFEEVMNNNQFNKVLWNSLMDLLELQYANGGFPNSINFKSANYKTWYDIAAPMRWNAYVFLLLTAIRQSEKLNNIKIKNLKYKDKIQIEFIYEKKLASWEEDLEQIQVFVQNERIIKIEKHETDKNY